MAIPKFNKLVEIHIQGVAPYAFNAQYQWPRTGTLHMKSMKWKFPGYMAYDDDADFHQLVEDHYHKPYSQVRLDEISKYAQVTKNFKHGCAASQVRELLMVIVSNTPFLQLPATQNHENFLECYDADKELQGCNHRNASSDQGANVIVGGYQADNHIDQYDTDKSLDQNCVDNCFHEYDDNKVISNQSAHGSSVTLEVPENSDNMKKTGDMSGAQELQEQTEILNLTSGDAGTIWINGDLDGWGRGNPSYAPVGRSMSQW
ncbi:hypothetical protein BS50DRAFT_640945 [Corynespora cassiicola Philippines]|uniref:Uncharacterized protein n=1 Tax=Corynespora cassiicola Philippines TaxID=1448308 RepID=A0A2T2N1T4_CORCC|nr:hypothetical protein BS50DRAFT_640945 [Corynespora cassiicola Philippines]